MMWQTPKTSAGGNVSRGNDRRDEQLLAGQAQAWQMWATPKVSNASGPGLHGAGAADLQTQIQDWPHSLPDLVMRLDGQHGSATTPAPSPPSRVLSAAFVEALMGWPGGLTDYECSETAASPQQWRSRFLRLLARLGCYEP